jgi:serine/threonine-protein phosphatase 5
MLAQLWLNPPTNRSVQANIKLEAYGLAIIDADKAIELDPNNVKAYYRRASANTAILHHREALRDWKLVVKKAPNDATAKLRMADCDKVVKRDAFLKAIEVEDAPSAAEGLDLDSMVVDSSYDGMALGKEMTVEFIEDMIERFKNGKKIARKYVFQIIIAVLELVKNEPTMVEVDVDEGHEITVCGDTHGKFHSSPPRRVITESSQANFSIYSRSSGLPENHLKSIFSCSMVTLWTEGHGQQK